MYGLLWVGVGAVCGAGFRWGLGALLNGLFPIFPIGTLAANWIGSFLMGIYMFLAMEHAFLAPELRLAIATGFLGSLTTFSTFSAEAFTLFARGEWAWFSLMVVAHVVGSIGMVALGYAVTKWVAYA